MSNRKKRYIRKKREKKSLKRRSKIIEGGSSTTSDIETLQLGPITLERNGRFVSMRSNWDPEQFKEFTQQVKQKRPDFKNEISKKIEALGELLHDNNLLDVLTNVSLSNLFTDREEYREITHKGSEAKVEFLISLATAFQYPTKSQELTLDVMLKVSDLLDQIFNDAFWYYGTEFSEPESDKEENTFRQMLLGKALHIRGDAYWPHLKQTFLELYPSCNEILINSFGFTAEQFLETLEYAEQTINQRIQEHVDAANKLKNAHVLFIEWSKDKVKRFSNMEELIKAFRTDNPIISEEMNEAMIVFAQSGESSLLRITPRTDVDYRIIGMLACAFGENTAFLKNLPDWPGWPLNPSIIYERPIVKHEGNFYMFHAPLALRTAGYLLEQLIKKRNAPSLQHFLKKRDEYLEKKSLEILGTLLPCATIYPNLYYPTIKADGDQWFETDAMIVFDTVLFIVEAKAGRLSNSARRGSPVSLKNDLMEIIGKAHEQGLRTLEYLRSADDVAFYDDRHNQVLKLEAGKFANIFVINVTHEQLDFIASQLGSVKKLGVLKGHEWPWTVYLNDLRVISEIMDHPTEFIHYLKCRIPLNNNINFAFVDELDIFMFYLKGELYPNSLQMDEKTMFNLYGYTQELDSYYLFKEGVRSEVPKPKKQLPPTFETLLTILEKKRPQAFVDVAITLLNCSDETKEKIGQSIERIEKDFKLDNKPHTASFWFSEIETAILLVCPYNNHTIQIDRWSSDYIEEKGFKKVIVISWTYPLSDGDVKIKTLTAM